MRIIAGIGKGRKLFSPPSITRPTSDRAREGLFSSLISTFGTLEGLHFLDLFAGSAAVGVEALSRGAALVEAVESNSVSADVCEENFALLSSLTGVGKFKVHNKTVFEFLNHTASNPYEIIYIDPPYEVANSEIEKILKKIISLNLLSKFGVIAIERDGKVKAFTWPPSLTELKVRSYGAGSIHYGVHTERDA
ncbi:16S rRNA (guanine966-N2)-methyltransferase [Candidatus Nanopelagicus abundans]|jgi:16S rRNA (guanine966-N2)-methyltransferase|uniref:16S rRNA (Guanine966-N2)-methyltransferase n=2 Tax=Candidatus Nanopelagicus abundans TaxID=1884916 RepID=A0A249L622_9ACTN|nr:16S rRNA (guanine966-N2)-methyltransferase [Candidatus Nanopelagicus abundans]